MFQHKFTPNFKTQRKAFVQAKEFAEVALDPQIKGNLESIGQDISSSKNPDFNIWKGCLRSVSNQLIKSVFWNTALGLTLLSGVWAGSNILNEKIELTNALLLCLIIFSSEIFKTISLSYDLRRRGQIARGVQIYLMNIINRKFLHISPSLQGDLSKGNLKTLISTDIEAVEDFITAASASWIPITVMLVVLTPMIYYTSGTLGLCAIGISYLQVPFAILMARKISHYQDKAQKYNDSLTTLVGEWVRNIRLIRYLGWQSKFESDIASEMRKFTRYTSLRHLVNCVTFGVSHSWWMMPILAMLSLNYFFGNRIDLASFFASIWALNHLTNYIQHLPYSISLWGGAVTSAKRIKNFINAPEISDSIIHGAPITESLDIPVRVHLQKLTQKFSDRNVINELNLVLNLREKTAIVGEVGSGKSILIDLICGELAPTSGEVDIEFASGLKANLWIQEVYDKFRENIAIVPQTPFLSNTSFRNNISLDDVTESTDISGVVAAAQLKSDVDLFTHGLDEEIGETGINLSGGQKQRVSIGRAFLSNRDYLVMDDPLSAVDRNTESKLMQEIIKRSKGFLLISHRLDELEKCDRIIVLANGKIIEDDLPQTLLANQDSEFNKFIKASENAAEKVAEVES